MFSTGIHPSHFFWFGILWVQKWMFEAKSVKEEGEDEHTLWSTNSLLLKPWPIEFVDLPINGDFPVCKLWTFTRGWSIRWQSAWRLQIDCWSMSCFVVQKLNDAPHPRWLWIETSQYPPQKKWWFSIHPWDQPGVYSSRWALHDLHGNPIPQEFLNIEFLQMG